MLAAAISTLAASSGCSPRPPLQTDDPADSALPSEDSDLHPGDSELGDPQAPLCLAHCGNAEIDCGETGVDCGGADCPPCGVGQTCLSRDDCETGLCAAQLCQCASPSLIMVATTQLMRGEELNAAIRNFQRALDESEGVCAVYIEADAADCLELYGTRVEDPTDWTQFRTVFGAMTATTGARDFLLLGGQLVIPRPHHWLTSTQEPTTQVWVESDSWFFDFDDDWIADPGYSVGRMPDLGYESSTVVIALDGAAELHRLGGFTLDSPIFFGLGGYETPPYGVCDACDQDAFFELLRTHDHIILAGHGSPTAIGDAEDLLLISAEALVGLDLSDHRPVVEALGSCRAGHLNQQIPFLAYGFLRSGVAAYIARTTTEGVPTVLLDELEMGLYDARPIGAALYDAILASNPPELQGSEIGPSHQVNLHGDPTLRRRMSSP